MIYYFTTVAFEKVGTISANGEREIGELIAKAMERVGKEGVITIAVSSLIFASFLQPHEIASSLCNCYLQQFYHY